jgi:non-canonical (house-cleaning) NTP pyrophosphatase
MKKVYVASLNKAKMLSARNFYSRLFDEDVNVVGVPCESNVSSKPMNYETFVGCRNRLDSLFPLATNADVCVAIESGFFEFFGRFYISSVAMSRKKGELSTIKIGVSDFYEISKSMFDCAEKNISINKIITKIEGIKNDGGEFKQYDGILGFLTNKKVTRAKDCFQALVRAEQNPIENVELCPENLSLLIEMYPSKKVFTPNFEKLDSVCETYLQTFEQGKSQN